MAAVAEAKGLSLRYPYQRESTLRDLSFHLQRGEKILLLGPSGSGKSQ